VGPTRARTGGATPTPAPAIAYGQDRRRAYTARVSFPWLDSHLDGSPAGAAARLDQARRELRERAALLARLGFTAPGATARLQARVAWDFDPPARTGGPHRRPQDLSDAAIAALVTEVYQRYGPR